MAGYFDLIMAFFSHEDYTRIWETNIVVMIVLLYTFLKVSSFSASKLFIEL